MGQGRSGRGSRRPAYSSENATLCAKAGEGLVVAEVGALGAAAGGTAGTVATARVALTAATATATTAELAAALAASTSAAGAATAAEVVAGSRLEQAVAVELDKGLLLALAGALGLLVGGGNVALLLLLAGDGGALGELLGRALVGLADLGLLAQLELLLGELSEVLLVRLALVFGLLLLGDVGGGVLGDGLLLVLLGDGLAGGLVGELGIAVVAAPAVGYLLVVVAGGVLVVVEVEKRGRGGTYTTPVRLWRSPAAPPRPRPRPPRPRPRPPSRRGSPDSAGH